MKKIVVAIILLLFCSEAKSQNSPPDNLVVKIDTVRSHCYPFKDLYCSYIRQRISYAFAISTVYDVDITISNPGHKVLYYWMMTCAKEINLAISNPLFKFVYFGCDSNFPAPNGLGPSESETFQVSLIKMIDPNYT